MRSDLSCKRCDTTLVFLGEKRIHEGTNWGVLGEIGEMFVKKEDFELYACPSCGSIEWFLTPAPGDPAVPDPDRLTWKCDCGEVNLRSADFCKSCGHERHYADA